MAFDFEAWIIVWSVIIVVVIIAIVCVWSCYRKLPPKVSSANELESYSKLRTNEDGDEAMEHTHNIAMPQSNINKSYDALQQKYDKLENEYTKIQKLNEDKSNQYDELQEKYSKMKEENECELKKYKEQIAQFKQTETVSVNNNAQNVEMSDLKKVRSDHYDVTNNELELMDNLDKLFGEHTELQQKHQELSNTLKHKEDLVEKYREKSELRIKDEEIINSQQLQIDSLQNELETMKEELANEREKNMMDLKEKEQIIEERQTNLDKIQKEADDLKAKCDELLNESKKIRQESDEKFEELAEANVSKQQTIETLTKKLNCVEFEQGVLMNAALDDTKSELQMMKKQQGMEQNGCQNEELEEYKMEIANYKEKVRELEAKYNKLQGEYDELCDNLLEKSDKNEVDNDELVSIDEEEVLDENSNIPKEDLVEIRKHQSVRTLNNSQVVSDKLGKFEGMNGAKQKKKTKKKKTKKKKVASNGTD